MINYLTGTVTAIENSLVTLEIAGIGFGIAVSRPEYYTTSQSVRIVTYFHWNQETGPQIFGFSCELERQAFMLIISCSGIGPKIALSILQQRTAQEFLTAIALADSKELSSLKGIGLKKAESMILQLQDKVKKIEIVSAQETNNTLAHIKSITQVLESLSYSRQEIALTIDHLKQKELLDHHSFDELVRRSLAFLAKSKNL